MSKYDRRPLREWEEPKRRRSATQQIGAFRLVGFIAIMAGSFLVFRNFGSGGDATTPTSGTTPRVAVDAALAPVVRIRVPRAKLTTGTSDELVSKIRSGLVVDVAVLGAQQTAVLAASERCSEAEAIAERGSARYAACLVNAKGSSRALAAEALTALTDLKGRGALLDAGFDVPEVRPEAAATTPATSTTP